MAITLDPAAVLRRAACVAKLAALDGGTVEQKAGTWHPQAVDYGQREVSGLVAAWALDKQADLIDPHACDGWLSRTDPMTVPVLFMHDSKSPPVGCALEFRVLPQGLWSRAKIFTGAMGDRCLDACREMLGLGKPIGTSIGYVAKRVEWTKHNHKTVRRILDLDLREWSLTFADAQANSLCQIAEVKTAPTPVDNRAALQAVGDWQADAERQDRAAWAAGQQWRRGAQAQLDAVDDYLYGPAAAEQRRMDAHSAQVVQQVLVEAAQQREDAAREAQWTARVREQGRRAEAARRARLGLPRDPQ